jgi:dCTP diphosphatase
MSTDDDTTLGELKEKVREFTIERDWEKYHNSKDLSMALAVEAAELMEPHLWDRVPSKDMIEEEMADIMIYLLELARINDIDLSVAFHSKMNKNSKRYPSDKVRGRSEKYTYFRNGGE